VLSSPPTRSPGPTVCEVRIVVTPTWTKLIDFETTLPSAVEELLARQRDERQRA